MEMIRNKPYNSIMVGDKATLNRTLTRKDIQLFAIMSGDVNPAHVDEEYANSSQFHHIIAHGMWGGALVSTVLGTQLPGPGTIYLKQDFTFRHPVSLGDNLTVTVTVVEKREHHQVLLDCACINQDGEVVIDGQALVKAPTEQIDRPRAVLPAVELKEQSSDRYQQFMDMAKGMSPLKTCVVHPVDLNSLAGALEARSR